MGDAFEDLMNLLRIGFSFEKGWGEKGLRIGAGVWNRTRWDFLGAQGDKGILFTEYSVNRGTYKELTRDDFQRTVPAFNWYGPHKPWMPINNCDDLHPLEWQDFDPRARVAEYWKLYRMYSRPIMTRTLVKSSLMDFCI